MQELAPAKVNLFLKITSIRKDGYHNILSLFQTISLYDKINIEVLNENKIIVDSNFEDIKNNKNLCYRVAEFLKNKYNIKKGIKIYIEKNIPIGSGLGGASSDAATVIYSLNKIFNLKIKEKELTNFCSNLGKDIPYFLYKGLCLIESTGEKITKIKDFFWRKKPLWFVLVYPNKPLMTKDVYNKYDEIKNEIKSPRYNKKIILESVRTKDFYSLLHNDLELAAIKLLPEIRNTKDTMFSLGAQYVCMSGSGSTLFSIFLDKKEAEKFYNNISKLLTHYKIFLVQSLC